MAFKPNRELLNVNFEGYKLSESLLSHVSKDLAEEVQVARLKEEDYSYQHMRAYSLHNHLAVDPYREDAVYWYTADGKIQQGTYKVSKRDDFSDSKIVLGKDRHQSPRIVYTPVPQTFTLNIIFPPQWCQAPS